MPGAVTDAVGIPGTPGAPGTSADDLAPDGILPAGPFAVTKNVYDALVFKPAKSHVKPTTSVQAGTDAGLPDDVTV